MKNTATEAKVIAGELVEDAKRLLEWKMVPEQEDEANCKQEEPNGTTRRAGKRNRGCTTFYDPTVSTPNQQRRNRGGGDVTDSDSELDTDQKCTACRGVFDYSKKADCVRFRCYECVGVDAGRLLCKVCVVEHRAQEKHRCRKRLRKQIKKPPRRRPPKKNKGGKPPQGGNKPDGEGCVVPTPKPPGVTAGTELYSAANEEEFVEIYNRRVALYAPTAYLEAQERELSMQIKIAELKKKLKAA